jgi:hypothetical protein
MTILLLSACKKNPVDRLTNPDGRVPRSSGIYSIFEDDLLTAGGIAFIPFSGNQSIELIDQSAPRRGRAQVRYSWNGQDVLNGGTPQHLFAGFQFIITPDQSSLAKTPGRDLSGPGYSKLTLYVRGNLSLHTSLRIEGPDDANESTTPARTELSTLSNDWTKVTLSVPSGDFVNVKSFITVSFQYDQPAFTTAPGEGGVVYLDGIQYEN